METSVSRCPGGKKIFVVREPKDVLVSAWNFFKHKEFRMMPGRGCHSSTFRLEVSTFCGIRWVYWLVTVT
jgi:hypothetical protein